MALCPVYTCISRLYLVLGIGKRNHSYPFSFIYINVHDTNNVQANSKVMTFAYSFQINQQANMEWQTTLYRFLNLVINRCTYGIYLANMCLTLLFAFDFLQ